MKHFYVVFLSIILFSCSNDDDSDNNQPVSLQGEWNLVNVTNGFAGIDQDLETGTIIWDFNTNTSMVTITNTSIDTSVNTLLPSGTYTYSVSAPADADLLIVNEVSYGRLDIENTMFTLNETIIDGSIFRFER